MKKIISIFVLILVLTPFTTLACEDWITIQGRIVTQNHAPISGAKVQTGIYSGYTNPFGWYSFEIPNCWERTFSASAKGYKFDTQTYIFPIPDTKEVYELLPFVAY